MMKQTTLQGENSIIYNEETMNAIMTWWLQENQFGKAVAGDVQVLGVEQSRHEVPAEVTVVQKKTRSKKADALTVTEAPEATVVKKFFKVTFRPTTK